VRAFLSCLLFLVSHHVRSPFILVSLILFSLTVSAAPEVSESGLIFSLRTAGSFSLGVGHVVLLSLALVLPFVSRHHSSRSRFGAARGRWFLQGASVAAHGAFLLLLALCLVPVAFAIMSLRQSTDVGSTRQPIVREVLDSSEPFLLHEKEPTRIFQLDVSGLAPESRELHVRFRPSVVVIKRRAPQALRMSFPLDIAWRPEGTGSWRLLEPITFRRNRSEQISFVVPVDATPGRIELRLHQVGAGHALSFPRGGVLVLGGPASFVYSLILGFVVLGLAAWSLMACCLWFSRFVAYPLAVAAALTLLLIGAVSATDIFPGFPVTDPGRMMATGQAVGWGDLAGTGFLAVIWTGLAVALPFQDPRVEERT